MDQQTTPLVCPAHTAQYIGAVILGVIVGAGASFAYFNQGGNSYQAGWNAARERVEKSAIGGMIHSPDDIRNISGAVTAIDGNRITIHLQSGNPFEDPALDDRIIVITADTKILKLVLKDPKVFQSEVEEFSKTMPSSTGLPAVSAQPGGAPQGMTPPDPFTRTPADVSSIAVGNTLSVTAAENIKMAKEFSASEIQIQ